MQFTRIPRPEARAITGRKLAAYARSCKAKQDRLPLLAPLIAENQLSPEAEMSRRQANDLIAEQASRDRRAAKWREVRARLFALPSTHRNAVLAYYHGSRWLPRNPETLATIIWREVADLPVNPDEVAPFDPATRLALTRSYNDRARAGDPFTRSRRAYSPGAMAWLAPGFEPSCDYARPQLHLHTSRGRWSILHDRVAHYDEFSHNTDPTHERRAGYFEAMGAVFRFEVCHQSPADDFAPSAAPWNLDLSRRAVWLGLADEPLDLRLATFESGWTYRPRDTSPLGATLHEPSHPRVAANAVASSTLVA